MTVRAAWVICMAIAAFAASPAWACMPLPLDPPLPGESNDAYQKRTQALIREREERYAKERQSDALASATTIFIARYTLWSPPYRPAFRRGVPVAPRLEMFVSTYFKPVDWFRGPVSRVMLRVGTSNTSCGPMSIGDTTFGKAGDLYVFFARKGPLSEKTLIDAIAVDKIDDPMLAAFVARYRGKSATR